MTISIPHTNNKSDVRGVQGTGTRCPACDSTGMTIFYEQDEVPIHSCLMLDSRDEAIALPTRSLKLGFCRRCGFVSNVTFDPTVMHYDDRYEDQQSFSPAFRQYQTDLVKRLIHRYGLRQKDIIEIGCGKGDFLREICLAGNNRGIGIDPRSQGGVEGHVRFLREYLNPSHATLPCDFLCCRHTLEHIHQVGPFIRLVRAIVQDRTNVVVFFELPDAGRIFRERAFWDIYYEHCSYWTSGSLEHVFRSNGFDIVALETAFDGQHLLMTARPTNSYSSPSESPTYTLDQVSQDVFTFACEAKEATRTWQSRIRRWQAQGRRIAIWGGGSKCVAFISGVTAAYGIDAIVDINPGQQGKFLPVIGMQITAPNGLSHVKPDVVIIMNPVYRSEIEQQLCDMGIAADIYTA